MTETTSGRWSGLRTTLLAGLVAGALLAALGVLGPATSPADPGTSEAAAAGTTSGSGQAADPATAARDYLAAVAPLAETGGRIVERGMKPGLSDIAEDAAAQDLLIDSAVGWADQMRDVQRQWRDVAAPGGLEAAHERFLGALDRYVGVAIVLEEAARTAPDERGPFIDLAASEGESADDAWDAAGGLLRDHLISVGVEVPTWLPDASETDTDTDAERGS